MKTFNKIYQELLIRFGEEWETAEIEERDYPFQLYELDKKRKYVGILKDDEVYEIVSNRGVLYRGGVWATVKVTEKPEKWVVEKNEQHPMWDDFKRKWNSEGINSYEKALNEGCYFSEKMSSNDLLIFTDHQYLTLDQWAELFLDDARAWGLESD